MMELTEFADIAYTLMTGIPGWGSAGFAMMGPDELRRQRITFVKYWIKKLGDDLANVKTAMSKSKSKR